MFGQALEIYFTWLGCKLPATTDRLVRAPSSVGYLDHSAIQAHSLLVPVSEGTKISPCETCLSARSVSTPPIAGGNQPYPEPQSI